MRKTPGIDLLAHRDDIALLWDLRIAPMYRRAGVGRELFRQVAARAREGGCRQLKIGSQNNNVGACRFYLAMGTTLGGIDFFAYRHDEALRDECALYWYFEL